MMIARLFLAVLMLLNLAACGGGYDPDSSTATPATATAIASISAPSAVSNPEPAAQAFESEPGPAMEPVLSPDSAIIAQFSYQLNLNTVTVNAYSGASATEGKITSYAWDFGDGDGASGASVAHMYASPGQYPVRLTVTDADGNSTSATQILLVPSA